MPRLLLALLAITPLGAQLIVDTYAGGTIRSGVPAQNVALGSISSLTWDPSGNIVFCDTTNDVIRRIRPDGIMETIVGTGVTGYAGDGGPATSALIDNPYSPAFDASGNLYFLDYNNYRIRRVDTKGVITTIAGDGQAFAAGLDTSGPALSRALAISNFIAVDPSGIVYYGGNNNLSKVTAAGNIEVIAPVNLPNSIVIDPAGNPYVSSATGTIYRISPTGTVSTFVSFPANTSNYADLLFADAAGNVTALVDGQLLRYAPDGTSAVLPAPSGFASFRMAMNSSGTLALAASPVIQTFTNQAALTTVGGANPLPASDGTPLRSAWFLNPSSIAFSRTGDLYIAESGACLIRKISTAGVLTTFAATGTCSVPPTPNSGYPVSITIDSQNRVWIFDSQAQLYWISPDGTRSPIIRFQRGGSQQLAIDAKDRVYMLGSEYLYRVLSDLSYQPVIAQPTMAVGNAPTLRCVGADSTDNIYFGGSIYPARDSIYLVNDDLTFTLKYPDFDPFSIAFDARGNLWGATGGLSTFNSTGISYIGLGDGFSGDGGPLQSARLSTVQSIGFGPDGDLYFIDNNTRIRRIAVTAPPVAPVISQNGIVNAANYAPGPIAPGELISIFGSNLGGAGLQTAAAPNNILSRVLGRTRVFFYLGLNVFEGAVAAVTPNQINLFVPQIAQYAGTVDVQVEVDQVLSNKTTVPVVSAAPGLSQPILNQDGTLNSAVNAAPRGSIISLYGTGLGMSSPQLGDGYLAISTPYSTPIIAPSITIGGQTATILYAGDAPTLASGVFQINAVVPNSLAPGPQSVKLAGSQVSVFVK